MDDNQSCVIAIIEQGSISKAAQVLHVSQSALSQRLRILESHFGTQLFDRSKKPLRLTMAGSVYAEWAKRGLLAEQNLERDIDAITKGVHRRLRIGVSLPRVCKILPEIIERFYQEVDECVLELIESGTGEQLNSLLSEDAIDFAVFVPIAADTVLFSSRELCEEYLLYTAPADWLLDTDEQQMISLQTVTEYPFIMPPAEQHLNWLIKTMMDEAGLCLKPKLHSCSSDMTIEMIRRGLGASIVPSTLGLRESPGEIRCYAMSGHTHRNHLHFAARNTWATNEDSLRFMSIVDDWLLKHSDDFLLGRIVNA